MKAFFLILQFSLLLIMIFHDWLHIPPLTNIVDLKKYHSVKDRLITTLVNTFCVLVPIVLTFFYFSRPIFFVKVIIIFFYALLALGTIFAWWIPYIFGPYYSGHQNGFIEFENTHHFLPKIKNHVIPNTLHVILHLHVWISLFISCFI